MSRTLLLLGMLTMLLVVGNSAITVQSYLRHMKDQDQAGAALGMLFTIGYLAPVAAALLTLGAVPVRLRELGAAGIPGPRRGISAVMSITGGLMAVFAVLYMVEILGAVTPRASTFPLHAAATLGYSTYLLALVALALNVLGLAVALWRGPLLVRDGGPGWLKPLLVALAPIPFLGFVALLMSGVPSLGPLWGAALIWAALTLRSRADVTERT